MSCCDALMLLIALLTRLSLAASSAEVALGQKVESAGGGSVFAGANTLIAHEDARLLQQRASDCESLLLSSCKVKSRQSWFIMYRMGEKRTRQLRSARADLGIITARERVDEAAVGELRSLFNLKASSVRASVAN